MDVKATVITDEQGQDVMRFMFEQPMDVSLTGTNGTKDLKELFARLMGLILKDDVQVTFEKTSGYENQMYVDVCSEYVRALNKELTEAREKVKREGLAMPVQS